jgi:hypothetical protein
MLTDEELAALTELLTHLDCMKDPRPGMPTMAYVSRTARCAVTKLLEREQRLNSDEFLDQLAQTITRSAHTVLTRRASAIGDSFTAANGPEGVATAFARGMSLDAVRTAIAAPFAKEIGCNSAQCVNEFLVSGLPTDTDKDSE